MADVSGSSDAKSSEYTLDDVVVVMGTYDEEAAIESVLAEIEAATDGRAGVICVDSSADRTPEIAREWGAAIIHQPPRGYGEALSAGLAEADRPVVVTTDCDGTYPLDRLPDFLESINAGAAVVSGDRLTLGAAPMPALNRLGNRLFALIASVLAGRRVADTTTGMRAYRRDVLEEIEWTENTGLSAELLLRPLIRGYPIVEVPIEYRERAGETTLDPIEGGAAIAKSIVKVCLQERGRRLLGR